MTRSNHIYKNPDDYSKNNNLQFEFAMQSIQHIEINPDSRILDIGCGDGLITRKIAEKVTQGCIIGTDISQQMINHANEKHKEQKNLGFMQMDASKNIFKNQFDIITSFNCLHWIKDQRSALKGIAEAATDGAKIILLFSHKKSLYHDMLDHICNSEKWKSHFKDYVNPRSFYTKESYQEMLEKEHLIVLSVVEKEMSYQFQDTTALKKFFNSSMSQVTHLPIEKREEFLSDFTSELVERLQREKRKDNSITFWCLEVNATMRKKCTYQQKRIHSRF
jgi:trans-aconitate methyltransferase